MTTETTTETTTAAPEPIKLGWGLQPPASATFAWGARAIYSLRNHDEKFFANGKRRKTPKSVTVASIDLPYDRHEMVGGTDAERKALAKWLDTVGLKALNKCCRDAYLTGDSEDDVEFFDDKRGYAIKASPRASYGYLYIVAYKRNAQEP